MPCFLWSKIRYLPGELAPSCSVQDFAVRMSLEASNQTRLPFSCFRKMSNKAGGILVPRCFLFVRVVSQASASDSGELRPAMLPALQKFTSRAGLGRSSQRADGNPVFDQADAGRSPGSA